MHDEAEHRNFFALMKRGLKHILGDYSEAKIIVGLLKLLLLQLNNTILDPKFWDLTVFYLTLLILPY